MSDPNHKKRKFDDINNSTITNIDNIIINIDSNSRFYDKIHIFLVELLIKQDKSINELNLLNIIFHNNRKINYILPENKQITFKYCDKTECDMICKINKISKHCATFNEIVSLNQLQIIGPSKEIIEKLIFEACEEKETLNIYHYSPKSGWNNYDKVHRRDMSTLIFEEEMKNMIINDVNKFIDSEEDYNKYGIPYKRNYLFYGPPGSGKTSLTSVIANLTNRSIYTIAFDPELTDSILQNAINDILVEKAILLLEDIDCIFQSRNTNMNMTHVSFSALLNILDGVSRKKSLITIITSNHVQKLDPALIRPGRIDVIIEFKKISNEQIKGLFKLYNRIFSENSINKFSKLSDKQDLTAATISAFLFKHRDDILDDNNIIELFNKYLKSREVSNDNKYHNLMYS